MFASKSESRGRIEVALGFVFISLQNAPADDTGANVYHRRLTIA
ncbi:hypothetical protein P792_00300 [Asaia sp. SF2.1]|nr:hypothetical protein P792_00300 [Asaia sp. SF2.1]